MCGIHGIITTDTYATNTDDFIKDCFLANQVRGVHSSGIFQVAQNYDLKTFKKAVNGSAFIENTEALGIIRQAPRNRVTVGHVRHATQGARDKDENAHPFLITREDGSKLVGVHNGSLRNWRNKKNSKDVDVDSAWAFQMLADENADAFEYFDGPFCFVWYDTRDKDVLYVARNDERPFHFMQSQDGRSMLFASEMGMLGWLAERNKIKAKPFAGYKTPFLYADSGKIYKFSIKTIGNWEQSIFPKYDPSTTIYTPSSSSTSLHPYQRQQGMYAAGHPYSRANEYGGDIDEWDQYGDAYGMPWRQGSFGSGTSRDWEGERTEAILTNVKAVLKRHRDEREPTVKDTTVFNKDDLEQAIKEARDEHLAAKKAKEEGRSESSFLGQTLLNPNDAAATRREIQEAKTAGIYGLVVPYIGIMYDDELGECLGNAALDMPGRDERNIDASVRGTTSRVADKRYIHAANLKPREMVVVGFDPDGPYPHVIVEEIGSEYRQFVLNQRVANSAVH